MNPDNKAWDEGEKFAGNSSANTHNEFFENITCTIVFLENSRNQKKFSV